MTFIFSDNDHIATITGQVANSTIYVELWANGAPIARMYPTADASGTVRIEVAATLRTFLRKSATPHVPVWGSAEPYLVTHGKATWQLRYTTLNTSGAPVVPLTQGTIFGVLLGGVPDRMRSVYSNPINGTLATRGKYLSWATDVPQAVPMNRRGMQHLKLAYLKLWTAAESIRYTFSTGTVTSTYDVPTDHPQYSLVVLSALPPALLSEADIRRISIQVWNTETEPATIYHLATFDIQEQPIRPVRHVVFRNSAGYFDTVQLTGLHQATLRTDADTTERGGYSHTPSQGNEYLSNLEGREGGRLVSGKLTVAEQAYMRQLLVSTEVYLADEDIGAYLPIAIADGNQSLEKDFNYDNDLTFTYRYLSMSNHFAPLA